MLTLLSDGTYHLERTFPNLAGAGNFLLLALATMTLCALLFLVTRKKVHLLACATLGAYMLPLVIRH